MSFVTFQSDEEILVSFIILLNVDADGGSFKMDNFLFDDEIILSNIITFGSKCILLKLILLSLSSFTLDSNDEVDKRKSNEDAEGKLDEEGDEGEGEELDDDGEDELKLPCKMEDGNADLKRDEEVPGDDDDCTDDCDDDEDDDCDVDVVDDDVVTVVATIVVVEVENTFVGGRCQPKLIGTNETIAESNQIIAIAPMIIRRFIHLSYISGSFM